MNYNVTFNVRHNPNCPSPFEVRFVGKGEGRINFTPKDIVGYGKTFEEAFADAVQTSKYCTHKNKKLILDEISGCTCYFTCIDCGGVWNEFDKPPKIEINLPK